MGRANCGWAGGTDSHALRPRRAVQPRGYRRSVAPGRLRAAGASGYLRSSGLDGETAWVAELTHSRGADYTADGGSKRQVCRYDGAVAVKEKV